MKKSLLLFAFIYSASAFAQTGVNVPQLAAFDAAMTSLMTQYNVPGGQLAITYQGRLVYNRGFGYANTSTSALVQPNSIFRIASISKPVTSLAIMKLFEQGMISLDAKVFGATGILNDPIYQSILDSRVNDITVRMLLQHSGGWNRDISGDPLFNSYFIATTMSATPPASPSVVIQYMLANKMLDFTPGTQSQYSNFGFCILGRVIEKITGQNYADYVKANILLPCGITDMDLGYNLQQYQLPDEVNYYDYPGAPYANSVYDNTTQVAWPYGGFNIEAMDAHGGWVASAEDLCKLLVRFDKFSNKPDILLSSTIDTMIKQSNVNATYACGIAVNQYNNWWHNGSLPGTSTEFVRAGNSQLNWAIMCNSRTANGNDISTAIDNLVWNVLPSISSWPTHDLFTFTGLEEVEEQSISVYPNPAADEVHIDSRTLTNGFAVTLNDVFGNEIYSAVYHNQKNEIIIPVNKFAAGIYFVRIQNGSTQRVKRIVVSH